MLRISTLDEAIKFLSTQTKHEWTEAEVFDLVTARGIALQAVIPANIRTSIQVFEIGVGLVEKQLMPPGHSLLAEVFPFQVAELWQRGETHTSHPTDHDRIEGQFKFTTEPVRVTKDAVRFKEETLVKILKAWSAEQGDCQPGSESAELSSRVTEAADAPADGDPIDSSRWWAEDHGDLLARAEEIAARMRKDGHVIARGKGQGDVSAAAVYREIAETVNNAEKKRVRLGGKARTISAGRIKQYLCAKGFSAKVGR